MNSQCYIHGYPLACQNQLQDLFNLIREGEEFIRLLSNSKSISNEFLSVTLERIFKLLRVVTPTIYYFLGMAI